jgi:amino acid transporter
MPRLTAAKKLTLLPLIAATYCMVAGGPFGLEELVKMSGYRNTILILLVTPIVWSLPVALLVAELASALPEEGGFYVWVRRALGPFWGFQEAWLSLAASIFDMAIYPTLFLFYLTRLWPPAHGKGWAIAIGLAVIAVSVVLNLSGAKVVGDGSVTMTVLLLAPFVVFVVVAAFRTPLAAVAPQPSQQDLLGGILVAMWNYMGWDNASTIAGEVDRPRRTYPIAMIASVILVTLTYVVPVALAAYARIPLSLWEDGAWVTIGALIAGRVVGIAIMVAGMVSAFSMFNALVLSYSRLPVAMAHDRMLPRIFGRLSSRTAVPWFSVLVCAAAWAACLGLGFVRLVTLDALLYGLSLLLEFAALIALRVREPKLPRPYRIPGGLAGPIVAGLLVLPLVVIAGVRSASEDGGTSGLTIGAIAVVSGVVIYGIGKWFRDRRPAAVSD